MKTAILPTLRVEPKLRKSAEALLRPGETLSAFVEEAVQRSVERRRADAEFLARGLRHRDEAEQSGGYRVADEVLARQERKLKPARRKAAR